MKVLLVRAVKYQQATSHPAKDGKGVPKASQGSFFEVVTWGWKTGAKYRTRKFLTINLVFSYLKKLNAGKHLDDNAYSEAWDLALPFVRKLAGDYGITTMLSEQAEEDAAEERYRREKEKFHREAIALHRTMVEFCSGTNPGLDIKDFDELSPEERENFLSNVKLLCSR